MYRVFDSSILYISFWSSLYGVHVSFGHLYSNALFNVKYRAKKRGHYKSLWTDDGAGFFALSILRD